MKKYLLALLMLCPLLFVQNASAKIKIYVQATTAPYLYAWNGNGDAVNGGWPGTVMTAKETVNEKEFWVKEFDLDAVNIIFNNGSGSQTADITGITSDAYFTYNGATVYENITAQITGQEETHTWGVVGEFTDWNTDVAMTPGEEEGTWTATINNVVVTADKLVYEYKVRADGKWDLNCGKEGKNSANNAECVFPKAGTYNVTISFNANYYDVSASYEEVGGDDPQLTTYTIILNTNRQLPTDDAGDLAYAYVWTQGDVFVEQLGEWPGTRMTNNGPTTYNGQNGTSYVITFDAAVAPEMVIFHDNNGNQTDDFSLVFDESNIAQFNMFEEEEEQPETYAIVGDFWTVMDGETLVTNGWEDDHQMTVDPEDDAVYTLVVEDYVVPQPRTYGYRLRANNKWHVYTLPEKEDAQYTFDKEGTYTLTFTANVEEHTLTLVAEKQEEPQPGTTYTIDLATDKVLPTDEQGALAYAYVWKMDGENVVAVAEWPGIRMSDEGEMSNGEQKGNLYRATFTADFLPEYVVFNDGQSGEEHQTEDLALTFDDENFVMFNLFEEQDEEPSVYSIVGDFFNVFDGETLVVDGWEDDHDMTQSPDNENVYTLVYEGYVTPGPCTKAYKLRANHKWHVYDLPEDGNYEYEFTEEGTFTLTFTANVEEHTLTLVAEKQEEPQPETVYTVAGKPEELFGTVWDPTNTANDMAIDAETGLYTLAFADVTLEADADVQFKVVENHSWDVAYPDKDYAVMLGAGTYSNITITFNAETKEVNFNAEKQAVAQNFTVIYLNENDWDEVYAYVWSGEGENKALGEWPGTKMDKMNTEMKTRRLAPAEHDAYIVQFPAEVAPEMVIFNNGKDGTELQQTADLPLTFSSEGVFAYPESEPQHDGVYTVAGEPASLFGTAWDAENTANDMTWDDQEGAYTLTYSDVTVELGGIKDIEFKVVKDHDWGVASYPEEKNFQVSLIGGFTYEITFAFYPDQKKVEFWYSKTDAVITADDVFTVAGSPEILGSGWDPGDTDNDMTLNTETGLYELVKQNVDLWATEGESSPYQFKVVANHSWDKNWGVGFNGDNMQVIVPEAGTYDITFTFDTADKVVSYVLTPSAEPEDVYTVAGAPESLFGAYWDPSQNVMTEEDGVYTWTATNVVLKKDVQYEYKVVKNGNEWLGPEGINNGDNYRFTIPTTGLYNVTFTLTLGDQGYTITENPELISDEAHTMYFVNLAGWEHIYAYGFHYDDDNLVEFNGAWPGEETEYYGDFVTDDWGLPHIYEITYYGDHVPEFVVFSDGFDTQTVDLPFTEQADPFYAYENGIGRTVLLIANNEGPMVFDADITVPEDVLVSYTRNFTVGQKCTVVLPFDLTAEQAAAAGTFYTPMEPSGDKICFFEETAGIHAYTPYMFVAKPEVGNEQATWIAPFKNLEVGVIPVPDKHEVVLGDKGFFTFETEAGEVNSDTDPDWAYFGWQAEDGEFFKAAPGEVRPYRAFLKLKQDVVPQYSKLFAVFGDATGISAIDRLTNEGAVIYDLQGRRVQNPTRGLYIVNGKKVILK